MAGMLIFLGAGASKPFEIPTNIEFVGEFAKHLKATNSSPEEIELYDDIKTYLRRYFKQNNDLDLENVMTILDVFADKVRLKKLGPVAQYYLHRYYSERLKGESGKFIIPRKSKRKRDNDIKIAKRLRDKLKKFVWEKCYNPDKEKILEVYDRFFTELSKVGGNISRYKDIKCPPCEIFTTNYDLCVETFCSARDLDLNNGIEHDRRLHLSTLKSENYTKSYNVRLIKLHGSVDLYKLKSGNIAQFPFPLKPGSKTPYGDEVVEEWMIYPIQEKYIYKEPFFSMFNELKLKLKETKYWIIIGHSFRDDAIKNCFLDAPYKKKKIILVDTKAEKIANQELKPIYKNIDPIDGKFESEDTIDELLDVLSEN